MKKAVWIIFLSLLVFQTRCAKNPNPEVPCGFVQNSDGQRVSWKSQVPIKLYFDPSVPAQFYQSVQNAITTWERGIGRHVFDVSGVLSGTQPAQDGRSVVYWLSSWDPNLPQQQANTTIYWADNQLVEADVRINAQNFTYSLDPTGVQVDLESLILHELGHVLGLKHTDDTPSVMNKNLPASYIRRSLYGVDISDVKCEY